MDKKEMLLKQKVKWAPVEDFIAIQLEKRKRRRTSLQKRGRRRETRRGKRYLHREGFQEGREDGDQGQRGRGDHYISNYKIYEESRSGQCEGKCDWAEEGSNGGSQELQGIVGMAVPLVVGYIYI
jgi:flagellar biosynthesis/type III secretory pathway protein FliH